MKKAIFIVIASLCILAARAHDSSDSSDSDSDSSESNETHPGNQILKKSTNPQHHVNNPSNPQQFYYPQYPPNGGYIFPPNVGSNNPINYGPYSYGWDQPRVNPNVPLPYPYQSIGGPYNGFGFNQPAPNLPSANQPVGANKANVNKKDSSEES